MDCFRDDVKLAVISVIVFVSGNLYGEFVQILLKKFSTNQEDAVADHGQKYMFQIDTHCAVESILTSTILGLVRDRKSIVSSFIKQQLLENYNLFHHLQVLSRVLLIDTEYPYLTVYKYILHSIESDLGWRNEFHLTQMLEECLDSEFPQFSSLFSISIADDSTDLTSSPHVLQVIDLITINFKVGLPVDLILTAECMAKYNTIFRFILKMKWALSSVQSLHFQDIATGSTPVQQKLYLLRHCLLHIICTLQSHHMCLLLQIFSVDLQKDLLSVSSVDSLVQVHERHLTTALFHYSMPE
ncbi:hypothetical protein M8J76_015096 [Diaphorina citri]|nr:hypothetical protein M8J76_015096 [Diaphorina citri]